MRTPRWGAVQARPRLESTPRFQGLIVKKDQGAFKLNPPCFLSLRHYTKGRFEAAVAEESIALGADLKMFQHHQQRLLDTCVGPDAPKDVFATSKLCQTYAMPDMEYWRADLSDRERELNTGFEGAVRRGAGRVDPGFVELL